MHNSLAQAFLQSAKVHRNNVALWCRGQTLTYGDLRDAAAAISGRLSREGVAGRGTRIAVLSDRTPTVYIGILAALFSGAAYVPLNPRFPNQRNRAILERSGAEILICDERHKGDLGSLLAGLPSVPWIVLPESDNAGPVNAPQLLRSDLQADVPDIDLGNSGPDDLAYILFTSGSTGVPKGVPITNVNVLTYVQSATEISRIIAHDRTIQLVDLTFDLSVHDMFMTWFSGASLYSVPENGALLATRFVQEHEVTGWLSVPSTAAFIRQAGDLQELSMPSLRFSFFCGEALSKNVVEAWAAAAPNSAIFNLYGPTEATVAFSVFRYEAERATSSILPLGLPLPHQFMGVFSPEGIRCAGDLGEICLSGSQVMGGYWNAPEITAQRFFEAEGRRWYRTGDLGRFDPSLGYIYAGRTDRQVKLRGFRVELQEIETVLRRASGSDMVAVIPWPNLEAATSTIAFIMGPPADPKPILERCGKLLPDYMVSQRIIFVDSLPLNSNGKIDYIALKGHQALVSERTANQPAS